MWGFRTGFEGRQTVFEKFHSPPKAKKKRKCVHTGVLRNEGRIAGSWDWDGRLTLC